MARARVLFEECLELGDAPHRYAGLAGRGSFLALAALARLARDAGDTAQAAALIERSLQEHPEYLAAGLDLADTLLADETADPAAVRARLEAFGRSELTWWLFLGTAFYERGHVAHAEELFRRALAIGAQHGAARVGLVEALLSQHRYAEVESEHGDLPAGTAPFTAVQRARALAAALQQDAAALDSALAALAAGEEATDEVEAMRAVGAAVAGQEHRPLRPGAAPIVLRTLDALARLQEFEAFERTVPLLARAVGNDRAAALLLAELYLARGFYGLAGESALEALDADPNDVRALAVLAKSAVAQGMFAEAVPVLEACVALDPGQQSVQVLLAQVRGRLAA
jgi:Tfp pilus assembly protein PilF